MGTLQLNAPSGGGNVILSPPSSTATSTTLTLPAITDTVTTNTATQTLTNKTLTSPTINTPTMGGSVITSGTATASTSGTAINFTGLPSWVKTIQFLFNGVSSSGSSQYLVQLGYGGTPTYQTTGYTGESYTGGSGGTYAGTQGICVAANMLSSSSWSGGITISLLDASTNTWAAYGATGDSTSAAGSGATIIGFSVPLSGTLTAVRLTTVNGTDTFDAGKVNIIYG
jgi:hypothetical protein